LETEKTIVRIIITSELPEHRKLFPVFLLAVFFLLTISLAAQTQHRLRIDSALIERITQKRNFLLAPQLDRSPETGFLTGLYYLQLFKIGKDTSARTSNTETTLSYTQNNQFVTEVNNTLLFPGEKFILRGTTVYKNFSEYFYGIGNNTRSEDEQLIRFDNVQFVQRLTRVVLPHTFVGIQYQYNLVANLRYPSGGILDTGHISGSGGSRTSGAGLVFLYDSRDNVINSYKGFYLDISNYVNRKEIGSQYNFNNLSIDARKFFELWPRNILGLQLVMNFNDSHPPFRQLALMGGDVMMRGIYQGRFRDNDMIAAQAEYRFPVWRWLGFCVFGGMGEVADVMNHFSIDGIHYTYGAAVRVMFIKHERVNIGVDLGLGSHTSGVYFGSGESF
jgi:hypothetical protein